MIAVDSSALVAILLAEPDADRFGERLIRDSGAVLSVANYVETGQVLAQRKPDSIAATLADFHEFLQTNLIALASVDEAQARLALAARVKYGRGFGHPARLNYSDCFAYALAKSRGLPLLFKGDDFTHTDIVSALA
ncbi:MAG TPA: type II toxin-antitoxin system VapC family toxin [Caulobacteraceae bacterium]|nr:type II toxin-antitoxin system VapC family toxin [Caulobacteraceae bacterium]